MEVSIIIPHKGRFEMLRETLDSILRQESKDFEVIVVSQTPEIAGLGLPEAFPFPLRIFLRPEHETISAMRNFGVTHANGAYLAFLDADVYLAPDWIDKMRNGLETDKGRIIVSAMQVCEPDAPPLEKIRTSLSNADIDTDVAFLPGRNLFMRKAAFAQTGGFPEHLITCEDYYFTDKAARFGKLHYTSCTNYRHIGEDKRLYPMFKKEIWRGQSNIQSLAGRGISLRELPSFIVPPAILALLLIAIALLAAGRFQLAGWAVALALLPVAAYTLRLFRLAKSHVSFLDVFCFYLVYFPARAVGTLKGLTNPIIASKTQNLK